MWFNMNIYVHSLLAGKMVKPQAKVKVVNMCVHVGIHTYST